MILASMITIACLLVTRIYVCDKPDSFERLQQEYQGVLPCLRKRDR